MLRVSGIEPNLALWRYFFCVKLLQKEEHKIMEAWSVGCTSICLCSERPHEYILIPLSLSNKGWHRQWFYL